MEIATTQSEVYGLLSGKMSRNISEGDSLTPPGNRNAGSVSAQPWCVYETSSIHNLMRVSGLILKAYSEPRYKVFARGQSCPCKDDLMLPAIARGLDQPGASSFRERMTILVKLRSEIQKALPKNERFMDDIILAVLQHYGIRTHWLDVVDNLFVALWFACNCRTRNEPYSYQPADSAGHLYLLRVEDNDPVSKDWEMANGGSTKCSGGDRTKWCDLRRQHTSLSLRPYAQHGVSISRTCRKRPTSKAQLDLTETVLVEIRFPSGSEVTEFMREDRKQLMRWMFPPKCKDDTYARLCRDKVRRAVESAVGTKTAELGRIDVYNSGDLVAGTTSPL